MFTGSRGHKHIIPLLASYEHTGKHHLIFPRAESNLLTFWKELEPQPAFEYANILWMAEQCAGIAEGLYRLHKRLTFTVHQAAAHVVLPEPIADDEPSPRQGSRHVRFDSGVNHVHAVSQMIEGSEPHLDHVEDICSPSDILNEHARPVSKDGADGQAKIYGRHGDIHPGNMLWFTSNREKNAPVCGTLKIADFGQAELNTIMSKTKPRSVAHTVTYRPPECDLEQAPIRQEYDIWCLGCVYLEFVTWMLGGARLLNNFAQRRLSLDHFERQSTDTFFEAVFPMTHKQEVRVKERVIHFIDDLHEHPNCTEFLHELLNTIKYDMLVVDSHERTSCSEVAKRLRLLYKKCRVGTTYAAKRSPWESRRIKAKPASQQVSCEHAGRISPSQVPRAWQARRAPSLATM